MTNDFIQTIMGINALTTRNLFPITSRYYGVETDKLTTTSGKTIIYLGRRFLPDPNQFALLQEHTVTEGDRLDNITATYLSDPERFWRIADANNAMHPDELTQTIGRRLRITLPEGMVGGTQ
ncbi:MAG: LysM domain-containing protein [Nostoc sp.]|uniref:LysM domain-containing protein n=1 Tax=Nostoc sp. TaxID=1180 RepID=UPI002FF8002D